VERGAIDDHVGLHLGEGAVERGGIGDVQLGV
jgi:hypothetical protein